MQLLITLPAARPCKHFTHGSHKLSADVFMLAEHDRACFIGLLIPVSTASGETRVSANGSIKQATDYYYHDAVKKKKNTWF